MNNEKNLLIVILDTNPIWWGLQNSGSIQQDVQTQIQDNVIYFNLKKSNSTLRKFEDNF